MKKSELLLKVHSTNSLERAWRVVEQNGRFSKSAQVRSEIDAFRGSASTNLRSLSGRLSHNTFKFPASRGVTVPKGDKKDRTNFRPMVLATVEARIVQRAILDALVSVPALESYFRNPDSFGGIKRSEVDTLSAVPGAIQAVLSCIQGNANFVICADINSFFTRIAKSTVCDIISDAVCDPAFMTLFREAIRVELDNMAELRERAEKFPIGDIGVAQGNSLSPLLGNIILHEFDREMNQGDCRCIRYIDDFIILAPTRRAALARLKRAKTILQGHSMSLADGKTHKEPCSVETRFEFLGIELNNGLIRPSRKARVKLLASVRDVFEASRKAFVTHRKGKPLSKAQSLIATLRRVDGIAQGWGKQYRFCNDSSTLRSLDDEISLMISSYLGAYTAERAQADDGMRRALLGIELIEKIERNPFSWRRPRRKLGLRDPEVPPFVSV